MIGTNIAKIRKELKLSQTDFAEKVGISRNTLSRYENGTSPVTTDLIDNICEVFNLTYVDVVGKEKLLSPVEDYQLTFKIELLKEHGSHVLAELFRLQELKGIAYDDETNPWVIMADDLSLLIDTKIYLARSFEQVTAYEGYVDGIKRIVDAAVSADQQGAA